MNLINKIIPSIILIALSSIFVGIILPGILLYYNHTFFEQDVVELLDSSTKAAYQKNKLDKQNIENRRIQLFNQLGDTTQRISNSEINEAYTALNNLKKLKEENNRITIMPYYPKNNILLIWALLYFGFCSIILFNKDVTKTQTSKSYYFLIFILLYFFWRWAAWFRNTPLGQVNRVV